MHQKTIDLSVGILVMAAVVSLFFIALNASEVEGFKARRFVFVSADFDNISGLRVRAPVKISGVRIGEVNSIGLDPKNYRAHVVLKLAANSKQVPIDSEAKILTEGLLGSKYVSIEPGLSEQMLPENGHIERTASAMILESLIGKLVFGLSKK